MRVHDAGRQLRDAEDAHRRERERRKVEAQKDEGHGDAALAERGQAREPALRGARLLAHRACGAPNCTPGNLAK
ncbi:MAG: hypothetical protein CL848_04895 [Crocinitomicaceae bacterium]|nr:hypothetical protein [Crocinitomicaceae bacterium]